MYRKRKHAYLASLCHEFNERSNYTYGFVYKIHHVPGQQLQFCPQLSEGTSEFLKGPKHSVLR
jgi:hypothetical protein